MLGLDTRGLKGLGIVEPDYRAIGRRGGLAARGDKKRHGKLSWGEVNEIRADCRSSAEVAQDYGICRQHVDKIRRYDVWRSK